MGKRPLLRLAAGFLCGILAASYRELGFLCMAVLLPVSAAGVHKPLFGSKQTAAESGSGGADKQVPRQNAKTDQNRTCRRAVYTAVCMGSFLLMALCGFCRCKQQINAREQYMPYLTDGRQVVLQGIITGKQQKNEQYLYYVSSCRMGQVLCNQIILSFDSDRYSIGETLVLNGTIQLWQTASNEGNFDQQAFYQAQQIDFFMKNPVVLDVYQTQKKGRKYFFRLQERLFLLRERLKTVYLRTMGEREGGVLAAMAVGDRAWLEDDVKQLYQTAGISHILAISGLHISVIGMSLYHLLRKLRMGFAASAVSSAAVMAGYGMMTGMGTSVCRALLMFLLMVLAPAVGRSYDPLNALGGAAFVILWKNPGILFYAGFQFSFAAVIGAVWIGGTVTRWFHKTPVLQKIGTGAAIQLAVLPIAAWYYYEIPVYAVWLNLLVLPFVGVVLALGLVGGICGLYRITLAKYVLLLCRILLSGYRNLCAAAVSLPHAVWITGQPPLWRIALYYLLLASGVCILERQNQKQRETRGNIKYPLLVSMGLLFFLFFSVRGGFKLDVLDVGQGDGIFLRTENGSTVFVDGGSSNVKNVGQYRILPFLKANGIRNIDCWFVSHTDSDHISGLAEVLVSDYPVKMLIFAQGIEQDEALEHLLILAKKEKTKVCYMKQGDEVRCGDASFTALVSNETLPQKDKNEDSLVLWYQDTHFTGIFTGDIGAAREEKLLKDEKLGEVDFYKAAHHGSGYSNTEAFLQALHPKIAVISCAKKNRYGHPNQEAVQHMKAAGSMVFYTMEAGQITVTCKGEELFVREFRHPKTVWGFR